MASARTLLICLIAAASARGCRAAVVETSQGPVRGLDKETAHGPVHAFLGVPYARPPVGELRFERPVPRAYSDQVYNATQKSFSCPQLPIKLDGLSVDFGQQDEDCLYLNVWAPKNASGLPVIVYVHGGAFTTGSGNLFLYDGTRLAARMNVVYVTINMRLGPFGFLQMPTVTPVNVGLYDVVEALNWVRRNAKVFGGDPLNIAGWGQSAGAIALDLLMRSPSSVMDGLVRRAFLEGGSAPSGRMLLSADGLGSSRRLAYSLGCFGDEISRDPQALRRCLRDVSWRQILERMEEATALDKGAFQPVVDEDLIAADVLTSGRMNPSVQDVFVTTDEDEGFVFMSQLYRRLYQAPELSVTEWMTPILVLFKLFLRIPYRLGYDLIYAYVPDRTMTSDYAAVQQERETRLQKAVASLFTDMIFRCPAHFSARFASGDSVRVFLGEFHFRPSFSYLPEWAAMTHADEIGYLHGNIDDLRPGRAEISERISAGFERISVEDRAFSDQAMSLLADFFYGR